jgi:hypothetical protein
LPLLHRKNQQGPAEPAAETQQPERFGIPTIILDFVGAGAQEEGEN